MLLQVSQRTSRKGVKRRKIECKTLKINGSLGPLMAVGDTWCLLRPNRLVLRQPAATNLLWPYGSRVLIMSRQRSNRGSPPSFAGNTVGNVTLCLSLFINISLVSLPKVVTRELTFEILSDESRWPVDGYHENP